jgi:hypothetical protein
MLRWHKKTFVAKRTNSDDAVAACLGSEELVCPGRELSGVCGECWGLPGLVSVPSGDDIPG